MCETANLLGKLEKGGTTIIIYSGFNTSVTVYTASFVICGTLVNTLSLSCGNLFINYTEYLPVIQNIALEIPTFDNIIHLPFNFINAECIQTSISAKNFSGNFHIFNHITSYGGAVNLIKSNSIYIILLVGSFILPSIINLVSNILNGLDTFIINNLNSMRKIIGKAWKVTKGYSGGGNKAKKWEGGDNPGFLSDPIGGKGGGNKARVVSSGPNNGLTVGVNGRNGANGGKWGGYRGNGTNGYRDLNGGSSGGVFEKNGANGGNGGGDDGDRGNGGYGHRYAIDGIHN